MTRGRNPDFCYAGMQAGDDDEEDDDNDYDDGDDEDDEGDHLEKATELEAADSDLLFKLFLMIIMMESETAARTDMTENDKQRELTRLDDKSAMLRMCGLCKTTVASLQAEFRPCSVLAPKQQFPAPTSCHEKARGRGRDGGGGAHSKLLPAKNRISCGLDGVWRR